MKGFLQSYIYTNQGLPTEIFTTESKVEPLVKIVAVTRVAVAGSAVCTMNGSPLTTGISPLLAGLGRHPPETQPQHHLIIKV